MKFEWPENSQGKAYKLLNVRCCDAGLARNSAAGLEKGRRAALAVTQPFDSTQPTKPWILPQRGMAVFYGPGNTPRLSHYFLPRLLLEGKRVLLLDGANVADPRLLARLADGSLNVEELVISKRLPRPPGAYRKDTATAIVARQLDRSGVKLRPGETIEYIITDADSKFPDDRFRAFTLWEAWRGYDVAAYRAALLDAFKPFEQFSARVAQTLEF